MRMNTNTIWEILEIEPTTDRKIIKKAYALCAKKYHPEENPEGFERLKEAYEYALQYASGKKVPQQEVFSDETKTELSHQAQIETDEVDELSAEPSLTAELSGEPSLADLLFQREEQQLQEQLEQGAIKILLSILADADRCEDDKIWAEYFLSEEFLAEQFTERFLQSLNYYLSRNFDDEKSGITQAFLMELIIAYGLEPNVSGYIAEPGSGYGFQLIANIWNMQTEEWRMCNGVQFILRDENMVRLRAHRLYIELWELYAQEKIQVQNRMEWFKLLIAGKHDYLYEQNNHTFHEAACSEVILKLYAFLFKTVKPSVEIAEIFYHEYNLRGCEKVWYGAAYKTLKEVILDMYPDIEVRLYGEEVIEEAIRTWIFGLTDLQKKYQKQCADGERFEMESQKILETSQQLLEKPAWKYYAHTPKMIQMLKNSISVKCCPHRISETLLEYYTQVQFSANIDAKKLCMKLTKAVIDYRKNAGQLQSDFWEYFFMYGFGPRNIPMPKECELSFDDVYDVDNLLTYIKKDRLYLPEYIAEVYQSQMAWKKQFVHYDEKTGRILQPVTQTYFYGEQNCLQVEYHMHYINYTLNGELMRPSAIPFAIFQHMIQETESVEAFFALLAITRILPEERQQAKAFVLKWLARTPLLPATFETIADCIVEDNCKDMDTEQFFVMEQEELCLIAKYKSAGLQMFRYTTTGLVPMDFRNRINWSEVSITEILEGHLRPVKRKIAGFDVEGKSTEEKTHKIVEGFFLHEKTRLKERWTEKSLTNTYVVLQRKSSEYLEKSVVLCYSTFQDGFHLKYYSLNLDESLGRSMEKLQNRAEKLRVRDFKIERFLYEEAEGNIPHPVGRDADGNWYSATPFKSSIKTASMEELIGKLYNMENVSTIDVYEGRLSVSRLNKRLEYCFTEEDYAEYQNQTEDMPESKVCYFTFF